MTIDDVDGVRARLTLCAEGPVPGPEWTTEPGLDAVAVRRADLRALLDDHARLAVEADGQRLPVLATCEDCGHLSGGSYVWSGAGTRRTPTYCGHPSARGTRSERGVDTRAAPPETCPMRRST